MEGVGISGKNNVKTNFSCVNVEDVNLIELSHGISDGFGDNSSEILGAIELEFLGQLNNYELIKGLHS
jgi:hypothetical protein